MIKLKDLYPNQASFMKEESVNENRESDKVYGDFESLLRDFEKEFISLSAQAGRANDNKADERIMIKTLILMSALRFIHSYGYQSKEIF